MSSSNQIKSKIHCIGPEQSTPVDQNGGLLIWSCAAGRSAIVGVTGGTLPLTAFCTVFLVFLNDLVTTKDPVLSPDLCKDSLGASVVQAVIIILYEELCDRVIRADDDRMKAVSQRALCFA